MSGQVLAAIVTASVALAVALLSALASYSTSKRERKRLRYGEAVKAALAWHEMLYRVRRRTNDTGANTALVQHFHDFQEAITYNRAWISAESQSIGKSYARLVRAVKSKTEHLITAAWDEEVRKLPGNAQPDDEQPDVQPDADAFLADVRSQLSLQPWRRIALWCRARNYS